MEERDSMAAPQEQTKTTAIESTNADLGKHLVAQATNRAERKKIDKVMGVIEQQTQLRDEARTSIAVAQMQLEHYEKVLAAIEAGGFVILSNGAFHMSNNELTLGRFQPPASRIYEE